MLRPQLNFLIAIIVLNGCLGACSGTLPFGANVKDDAKDSEQVDDEDEPADQPVQVSGAFLSVLCDADGFSVDEMYNIERDPVVACIIKQDDGTRFSGALNSVLAEVFQSDGQALDAQATVALTPPWHFYVKTAAEDRKKVKSGVFQIATGEGTNTVSTKTFDYKWYDDPLIKGLVAALMGRPEDAKVKAGMEVLLRAGNPNGMEHLIFASNATFAGNVTVGAADAYCQAEGDALVNLYKPETGTPAFTWRALLGTKSQAARARIPIKGSVFNVYAGMVSQYPKKFKAKYPDLDPTSVGSYQAMFWDEEHASSVAMTQTGKLVNLFDDVDGRLQVIDYYWSGAGVGGSNSDPIANCNDWSQSSGALGTIGDLLKKQPHAINAATISCDRRARILCISARSEVSP